MKNDTKNPGNKLSMGYGFIQFVKQAAADKALKTLQHSMLDAHSIELKRSNRTLQWVFQTWLLQKRAWNARIILDPFLGQIPGFVLLDPGVLYSISVHKNLKFSTNVWKK